MPGTATAAARTREPNRPRIRSSAVPTARSTRSWLPSCLRAVAAIVVPPSSTAATCHVSCPMAAAATSGPSGCGPSSVVGLPRLPVAGAGRSATSPAATSRAMVSAANPLGIPISAAASARVVPGWSCTARTTAACADVRNPAFTRLIILAQL